MADLSKYPQVEHIRVADVIGVPHPFYITDKHVVHASDHFCGKLDEEAIKHYEHKIGRGSCGAPGCTLRVEEHKQALVIAVDTDGDKPSDMPGLHEYLLSIKDMTEKDGYVGFTFIRESSLKS